MAVPSSLVFFPASFQELFAVWNRQKDAALFAGGTSFTRSQSRRNPVLPKAIIALDKIDDLRKISRTERYLEIGAMVKLNQITGLGKIVPEPLTRCLESIAGPQLRNLATIGGNLCTASERLDAAAPMTVLDAQYELRTAQSSRWITASQFSSLPGPPALSPQEILTRIRVPLDPWTFTRYRKFPAPQGGAVLFIIRHQNNILSNIRVVYSGRAALRDKDSETRLLGKHLPLDRRDAAAFVDEWRAYLAELDTNGRGVFFGEENGCAALAESRILNFIETTLMSISD